MVGSVPLLIEEHEVALWRLRARETLYLGYSHPPSTYRRAIV